jgi:NSS family neurotransmitter:Na+ symporter
MRGRPGTTDSDARGETPMQQMETQETWSSRLVFLMAAVGAAVGLGNLWKFPYTAGVSGGAAFVIVYIGAIALVAVPIVMAELLIGRRGRRSPPGCFAKLAQQAGAAKTWRWVGALNVAAVFLILSFYSVIAGWALAYVPKLAQGVFAGASSDQVGAEFDRLLASPGQLAFWHAVFIGVTVFIVGRGIANGIERAVKFLMPALFVMLIALVLYAAVAGDMKSALVFLFKADFSKIDAGVVLGAIGQAFFSVSVAMGLLIAYGTYLSKEIDITKASLIIAAADTVVALLAGLAIFPLVFANGLDPAEGPGLIFVTLPIAFGHMPGGALFGTIFFLLLIVSALTSSIAVMEPIVAWADEHKKLTRRVSTPVLGALAWVIGLGTVFSFNWWGEFHPLGGLDTFADKTIFDLLDYLTSNIMLPLGGILIAVFAGWIMGSDAVREELGLRDGPIFRVWRFLSRYVCPIAIGAVLAFNLF